MMELKGKFNTAKIFSGNVDSGVVDQIKTLLDQEFVSGSKIRIMPDAHVGVGCTIGTTMTISDKIVPNLVGVDIGCGIETVFLRDRQVDLQKLDRAIHNNIPAGFEIRRTVHPLAEETDVESLRCKNHVNPDRARLSIGTLGGGNHFIEMGRGEDGRLCLTVHSGSRNLGKQVADYYQNMAFHELSKKSKDTEELITRLKEGGRQREIQAELAKNRMRKVARNLAYVEGPLFDDYLHDMSITQRYAEINRRAMVEELIEAMGFEPEDRFSTIHNYIDLESMILRKGAISAKKGERVIIPINMRDGSLICIGRGNPDWNYSAPHGAGRLMSRKEARQNLTLKQFEKSMEGIYSSTVNKSTLDESPFAYKPMGEIMANIGDTADISAVIKPIYNFKAAE